jgi:hypothetical protein
MVEGPVVENRAVSELEQTRSAIHARASSSMGNKGAGGESRIPERDGQCATGRFCDPADWPNS